MRAIGHTTSLTLLWGASFALAMLGSLYLRLVARIGPDASARLFELIIAQYAPYVGAVLGFHFAAGVVSKPQAKRQVVPFRLAMAMSSLWNLVTVGFIVQACLNPDLTEDAANDIKAIVPRLSWVVAPAIGFFFGKPAEIQSGQG
jgi:hypothetical protein